MSLDIMVIEEYTDKNGDQRVSWRSCGVAFQNRDGSINLKLDLFPNVRMQVRERKVKEDQGY